MKESAFSTAIWRLISAPVYFGGFGVRVGEHPDKGPLDPAVSAAFLARREEKCGSAFRFPDVRAR
jgi:hypothetical protein